MYRGEEENTHKTKIQQEDVIGTDKEAFLCYEQIQIIKISRNKTRKTINQT